MTNSLGTFHAPVPAHILPRINARAALFHLPKATSNLLTECFRQFGIETVPIADADLECLRRRKFEACVLPLGESVGHIIEGARSSASNSRIVIYGLGGTAQDAMRHSKYCINAVFQDPLERSAIMKLMRSTRPLVLHELRRYTRIPVMTDVTVVAADSSRFLVTSQEVSAGGMSVKGAAKLEPGQLVEVSLSFLSRPRISLRGHVAWKKPDKSVGIRFDANDDRRQQLKGWIVSHLES